MLLAAMVAVAAIASGAHAATLDDRAPVASEWTYRQDDAAEMVPVNNRSCASECQSAHDRCRVETKGSRTCDESRQRCLQVCLQKKKK